MGPLFVSIGVGLTVLLVAYVTVSVWQAVDPEDDDEDEDDTDLHCPHSVTECGP